MSDNGTIPEVDVAHSAIEKLSAEDTAGVLNDAIRNLPAAQTSDVVESGLRTLTVAEQADLMDRLAPDQAMTNDIWRWIVRTFALVLLGATTALIAAVLVGQGDAASMQMLLTIFTTTAGILAGFVSGRASTARR
jgi:hypothetical protein